MKINLDEHVFSITCPSCESKIEFKGKQVGHDIVCLTCGQGIHLKDKSFTTGIASINKSLDDFPKGIKIRIK